MLQPIAPSDREAAVALLCEGFPERSGAFWEAGLTRMEKGGLNREAGVPIGTFLMDKAEPVGIALTPASLRHLPGGETRRIINMSSWYVRPSHRWRAPMMLRSMVSDPEAVFTDFTPTDDVQKMLPVFGFQAINRGILIEPLAMLTLARADGYSLRPVAPGEPLGPIGLDQHLIDTHLGWNCRAAILERGGATSLILWQPTRVKGLPAAEILYSDNLEMLEAAKAVLARHLMMRGKLLLVTEARTEAQAQSARFRPRGIGFAKNDPYADRIDRLGSELCILDL
jgi:hypothetical protein